MGDVLRWPRRFVKHFIHIFGICSPSPHWTEGADHTGIDAYLRCPICRRRTATHVECERVTPEVRRILRGEWRPGNIEPKDRL